MNKYQISKSTMMKQILMKEMIAHANLFSLMICFIIFLTLSYILYYNVCVIVLLLLFALRNQITGKIGLDE